MTNILKSEPIDYILAKSIAGERISPSEALELYSSADFLKVIASAREVRNHRHDPSVATYTMFRIINYTTLCNVNCSFCGFHRPIGSPDGFSGRFIQCNNISDICTLKMKYKQVLINHR